MTAVEWIMDKLFDPTFDKGKQIDWFEQAKEMEKEQTEIAYRNGYTQCQQDMIKELKEWIEITLSAKSKLGVSDNVIKELLNVKYKIESLNKQD